MTRSKRIAVVTVSDDHYLILLAALVKSIEATLDPDTTMDLWVVDDRVRWSTRTRLESSIDPTITSLHWKPATEVMPPGTRLPLDRTSWPLNIYLRLFIPYFMPQDLTKVLYLDVDMIVLKDLVELWQTNLQQNIVGAVLDPQVHTFDNAWGGIANYRDLGLPGDTKYFNTGLLLIDLPKWREHLITEKTLECIQKNKRFAKYPDQYGLNVVLANRWLELDGLWNHFATMDHEAPYVIHFAQRKPIYRTYGNNPRYREVFYHYLSQTAWSNAKPIGESKRYLKKLSNIINKGVRKR